MIYHVVPAAKWKNALSQGFYEADSLPAEGFIHASKEDQVAGVLERYYRGQSDLVLLHIEESKLSAELKYELSPSLNEAFPPYLRTVKYKCCNQSDAHMITWSDFEKIDIRVGTILTVDDFPKARKAAYQLSIDFGESGIKKSSAQITALYQKEELAGKQVIAVTNFPPKQIGSFFSECLVLGVYDENNNVVLLQPGKPVKNGCKIG